MPWIKHLVLAAVLGASFKSFILPALIEKLIKAPFDNDIGNIPKMSLAELAAFYGNKRILIVGGTRGVGRGVALVMASAGANVTVVGRSERSGSLVIKAMQEAGSVKQNFEFVPGDIGTVSKANTLVASLTSRAQQKGKFDFLIVTAAVFPDWGDLKQEDGLEKGFAIAVVGRYIVYSNMNKFLGGDARVLNVLASGTREAVDPLDRVLATGNRDPTNFIEAIKCWAVANELMQIGLEREGKTFGTTRVSTHPGILQTELHAGQGLLMKILEPILVALMGVSEEEAGVRQSSILASNKLHARALSYVDQDMYGRLRSAELQHNVDNHLDWLFRFLDEKVP